MGNLRMDGEIHLLLFYPVNTARTTKTHSRSSLAETHTFHKCLLYVMLPALLCFLYCDASFTAMILVQSMFPVMLGASASASRRNRQRKTSSFTERKHFQKHLSSRNHWLHKKHSCKGSIVVQEAQQKHFVKCRCQPVFLVSWNSSFFARFACQILQKWRADVVNFTFWPPPPPFLVQIRQKIQTTLKKRLWLLL